MASASNIRLIGFSVFIAFASLHAAEKVTVRLNGANTVCDVVKVGKDGVVLKAGGREQTVALERLDPKEVAQCYKQAVPADAPGRFELGSYFFKKQLFEASEEALNGAITLDAGYKAKSAAMLSAIGALKEVTAKPRAKPAQPTAKKESAGKPSDPDVEDGGKAENVDLVHKFIRNVPPRSEADMKAFLDKRLQELGTIGGTWRMIETKHFYCFSNVPETKHNNIARWNEDLYNLLAGILRHKEGDKLWNNKMPIYYFEKFKQFQKFAIEIDDAPGAAYSGGYFSPEGREVHICVPFMVDEAGPEKADRRARNTMYHEGTHAFLQLTGENVLLSRWLHEGLAQFMEFRLDPEKNEARKNKVACLQYYCSRGNIPSWAKMKERPMSGGDTVGYAFAWAKLEFLYRSFQDKQKLPKMIRMIKEGKTEEEAMAAAFGMPVETLENAYREWVKVQAKAGFKFE